MTIDERLEALTQTVELLAAMQLDNEKRAEERHRAYENRFDKIATAIEQLTHVAEIQNQRLSRLEDQH